MFAGIWLIVGFFYRFPGLTIHSSTMGMRMTGIEFRQRHDRPFDGLYALLHTAGTMMAYATSLQPVSVILMLITSRKQGLVDLILATVVVNRAARRSSN
ncbi:RDD family protein [Planktomarina sp.]|nr:RDD family protein [Planktomarina sp.]